MIFLSIIPPLLFGPEVKLSSDVQVKDACELLSYSRLLMVSITIFVNVPIWRQSPAIPFLVISQ